MTIRYMTESEAISAVDAGDFRRWGDEWHGQTADDWPTAVIEVLSQPDDEPWGGETMRDCYHGQGVDFGVGSTGFKEGDR